jgi:hypothetical protein
MNPSQQQTEAPPSGKPIGRDQELTAEYIALQFVDCGAKTPLLYYALPCGNVYELKRGDSVPDEDVPCPCGNPNHWFVKIDKRELPTYLSLQSAKDQGRP